MPALGVLVTRPDADAAGTARLLEQRGFLPVLAPSLSIVPRPLRLSATLPQAVLVTSGNALAALPPSLCGLPMLAVGDATAARARGLGFACVHSASGTANDLERLAVTLLTAESGPVLLASGAGQGRSLALGLRERGFRVLHRVTYVAEPLPTLPEAAQLGLLAGHVQWALFFSTASAQATMRQMRRARLTQAAAGIHAAAISAPAASALAALPWRSLRVAAAPTQADLLACLP